MPSGKNSSRSKGHRTFDISTCGLKIRSLFHPSQRSRHNSKDSFGEKGSSMENIYVGLDIGTTKVCAIVASLSENNEINILGIGKSKSEGLTRGVITHIEKTIASIQAAVREAELQSGAKIQTVVAGIAGDHVQSFQSRGVIAISGAE